MNPYTVANLSKKVHLGRKVPKPTKAFGSVVISLQAAITNNVKCRLEASVTLQTTVSMAEQIVGSTLAMM